MILEKLFSNKNDYTTSFFFNNKNKIWLIKNCYVTIINYWFKSFFRFFTVFFQKNESKNFLYLFLAKYQISVVLDIGINFIFNLIFKNMSINF